MSKQNTHVSVHLMSLYGLEQIEYTFKVTNRDGGRFAIANAKAKIDTILADLFEPGARVVAIRVKTKKKMATATLTVDGVLKLI